MAERCAADSIIRCAPMGEAKKDLDSVWVPNETWQEWIFAVLDANGLSPDCDACLWASE